MSERHSPATLDELRRSVHRFLRSRAAPALWFSYQHDNIDYPMPPQVRVLPASQRPWVMADTERTLITRSHLYDLDEAATGTAVTRGAEFRQAHHHAVAAAGHPHVVARTGAAPPAPCGFLRWASGVGYCATWGTPIIACHWGPHPQGTWITWWADTPPPVTPARGVADLLHNTARPLWPAWSQLLNEPPPHQHRPPTGPGAAPTAAITPGTALIYTVLATWQALASPDITTITKHAPLRADARADIHLGIAHSTGHHVTTNPAYRRGRWVIRSGTRPTDRLQP